MADDADVDDADDADDADHVDDADAGSERVTRVVLDTSAFSNPATMFGADTTQALQAFTRMARQAGPAIAFYMPPAVLAELDTLVAADARPVDFELVVRVRAPRRHDTHVSGALLHELITDLRQRMDRGLRVAEEAARDARGRPPEVVIRRLREKYRTAMRTGFIDSPADVDVLLLAVELDAAVTTADDGLARWADRLGLRLLPAERIPGILGHLLDNPGDRS